MMMQQQVASDGAAAQSNGSPEQQNMVEQEELQQQHMAQDIDGLQQQDDAEYGDEMGGTGQVQVSNALAEQRASKKRAQDDVKLLANRIALLKLEEKKAWKKIEETKKKAIEIMKVRQRNAETRDEKQAFAAQRA
mmetsp:Transcript_23266/g.28845  ORF Transcript_23266/g.28845 Transcript_23266/m.28845 type:complete len:135 (+) Transcript_23266:31-435(+)